MRVGNDCIFQIVHLEAVDTTMAEAARRAPDITAPTWILADRQTAPRGRRGRAWTQVEGNFAATLILPPGPPPANMALRSFAAAVALDRTFVDLTGQMDAFALKWPNDVLLTGGKVAGILLESLPSGHLAIGVGVNLAEAPSQDEVEPGALQPVSLAEVTGQLITPRAFLEPLSAHMAALEAQLSTFGFQPIRTAWLARAARLGEVITARTAQSEVTGTFETVDDMGQLVLSTAKGRETIAAADVYF